MDTWIKDWGYLQVFQYLPVSFSRFGMNSNTNSTWNICKVFTFFKVSPAGHGGRHLRSQVPWRVRWRTDWTREFEASLGKHSETSFQKKKISPPNNVHLNLEVDSGAVDTIVSQVRKLLKLPVWLAVRTKSYPWRCLRPNPELWTDGFT